MAWVVTDGVAVLAVEDDRDMADAYANGYNRMIQFPWPPVTVHRASRPLPTTLVRRDGSQNDSGRRK